jgi:hypothetical protein
MATKRYVREVGKGRWQVLQEGHRRSALQTKTKTKAVAKARDIVRSHGGGEVRVMNKVGKIVAADKVAKPAIKSKSASKSR